MKNILYHLFAPAFGNIHIAICIMRVGIGILTIGHGIPKIMGGVQQWQQLGVTFMQTLGIYFLPIMWGFLGAATEFFGGIALTIGLGVRIASFANIIMMIIAFLWHFNRGDSFNQYSFPLSLIVVFLGFLIIGGDQYSLDYYLTK